MTAHSRSQDHGNSSRRQPSVAGSAREIHREAIFELRWALAAPAPDAGAVDPGFELLLGRLFERLRGDYPDLMNLPAAQLPATRSAWAVRHQFRSPGRSWPLVQVGPGVLTLNDAAHFDWSRLGPRVQRGVAELFEAYPTELHTLRPVALALRILDAAPLDAEQTPLLRALQDRLHTSLRLDPALFEDPNDAEKPSALNFSISFPIERLRGHGTLALSTAREASGPLLLWQIEVSSLGDGVPEHPEAIHPWTDLAQEVLGRWMRTLQPGHGRAGG
jgi:uncharacterized protein (TIGR04255 family)